MELIDEVFLFFCHSKSVSIDQWEGTVECPPAKLIQDYNKMVNLSIAAVFPYRYTLRLGDQSIPPKVRLRDKFANSGPKIPAILRDQNCKKIRQDPDSNP